MMDEEIIELNQKGFETAEAALTYLGEQLMKAGLVKESFVQALLEREKIFPTGLAFSSYGVALPHTDSEHVKRSQLALMTLQEPVSFTQMTTRDQTVAVRLIIMLAIKEGHSQVEMLQKLMGFLQDAETVQNLLKCSSQDKEKVITLMKSRGLI